MTDEHTDKYLEDAIASEHDHCVTKHGPFKNHHEAYGVMKEEMEEVLDASELFAGRAMKNLDALWLKVKNDEMTGAEENIKAIFNTAEEMVKEGIQVMAMCKKWKDLINKERGDIEQDNADRQAD